MNADRGAADRADKLERRGEQVIYSILQNYDDWD